MVAVPAFLAVITPFDTVATEALELLHEIDLFVAFDGLNNTLKVLVPPTLKVTVLGVMLIELTAT